ncbi:MAG: FAD-binding protein [Rhizomicrobium sp.]
MERDALIYEADVLVIGGGLAGTWAAVAAARAGATVILAEKGYCGTSGVTASAGPGHWWVPPGKRAEAVAARNARAFGLADTSWMARIVETTWESIPRLAGYYRFSLDDGGAPRHRALRGPEYMRAMRRYAEDSGVAILDQSPALELLRHADGSVAGAAGYARQRRRPWQVRAAAVVLASGGCAFASHLLGSRTNTGDGLLMAAEAGARLSGMEFTSYYTVAPAWSSMTRSMSFAFARYFDAAGRELPIPPGQDATRTLARALLDGPVFATLERMPAEIRAVLSRISPNFLLAFDRAGVDPFTQRFEIALRGEGTVRGIGGLRIADRACQTDVPGLFAAGDAATRELIAGATSGGGAQNSSWALSSGQWAGEGAAQRARMLGRRANRRVERIGGAGLRSGAARAASEQETAALIDLIRDENLAYDKNLFRSEEKLTRSLAKLDGAWSEIRSRSAPSGAASLRLREIAAMLAASRWSGRAALARGESRGMHQRTDRPATEPALAHRLIASGLDRVEIAADVAPQTKVA